MRNGGMPLTPGKDNKLMLETNDPEDRECCGDKG